MEVGEPSVRSVRPRARTPLLVIAIALLGLALLPAGARAAMGISSVSAAPADPTAGAHSDFNIALAFSDPGDDLRNLQLDLPAGVIGNPQATPRCSAAALAADACPPTSQVGTTSVRANALGLDIDNPGTVYNVEPNPGDPAKLGIVVRPLGGILGKFILQSPISVRDGAGDYGLTSTLTDIPRTLNGIPITIRSINLTLSGTVAGGGSFMSNPTRCTPAVTVVSAESYGGARPRAQGSFTATGCEGVPLSPAMELIAADPRTDANSAFTIGVKLPGDEGGRVQGHLRDVDVVLPRGVGLNPPVADGLILCTDEQFMPKNDLPTKCSPTSRIGDVVFETPVLAPLRGEVYFGTAPDDPYRLLIVAQDGNLRVKIQASVRPDPHTGQLTTVFRDLPQFPISRFSLTFKGGEKSVLATPPTCGRFEGSERITTWSGQVRAPTATFDTSFDGAGGCDIPGTPQVTATPSTRKAGADTDLTLDIVRPARSKQARTLTSELPSGLLGRIYDVPFCGVAQANRGTCSDASKLGTVGVDIGSGPRTIPLRGEIFLAAPASDGSLARLALAIPAKVGPIDLGLFTLLAPIRLHERTGRVTVEATVPEAFRGIRLGVRRVTLRIDRSRFLFNPTGCSGRTVDQLLGPGDGTLGRGASPFAVGDCGALGFAPRISLASEDASAAGRSSRPPLTVDVRPRGSDTALKDVVVAFPKALQPNIDLLQNVCNSAAIASDRCPPIAQIGTARATSPVLPYPLEGKVYLAFPEVQDTTSGPGVKLPWASVVLKAVGGPATIRVDGRLALRNGALEARFVELPDVPLTSFRFAIRRGAFLAQQNVCSPMEKAPIRMFGQSGARRSSDATVSFAACRRTPLISARLRRMRTTRPTVSVDVRRGPLGGKLSTLRLKLPSQLSVKRSRGVTVRVGKRVLSTKRWSLSRRSKTLTIRAGSATRVRVTLARGSVVPGKKTRAAARRGDLRLRMTLTARDTKKRSSKQTFAAYDEGV
jgi:hypothetical protein